MKQALTRGHALSHTVLLHPHSRLHPRKLSLISRGGEMPEEGQDLNSGLSNFKHKMRVTMTYPLQLL